MKKEENPNATERQTERQNADKIKEKGQKEAGVRCSEKTKGALKINEESLEEMQREFRQWLRALGYGKRSVACYESHCFALLDYVLKSGSVLNEEVLKKYIEYIQSRPNQRRSGGLSCGTLLMKFRVIKLLQTYLSLMKSVYLNVNLPEIKGAENIRLPLSKKQIDQLYKVINEEEDCLRDRVIMCLYYGCGLRRSEGQHVELKDLLLTKKLLYVRKGKWGKSRYIPLTLSQVKDLKNYLHYDRPESKSRRLLLNKKGNPISGSGLAYRLKKWKNKAELKEQLCLHVLRHSIATHLLSNGMSLQWVSRFLGHTSLVATQRYTHV